jgi:predicted Co/Zn/Cd cation transporter (cation efflux family)
VIRVKSNERHDIKKFIHRIAMKFVETSLWDSHNYLCLNNEWFNSFFVGADFRYFFGTDKIRKLLCRVVICLNKYLNNLLSYFYIMTPILSLTFSSIFISSSFFAIYTRKMKFLCSHIYTYVAVQTSKVMHGISTVYNKNWLYTACLTICFANFWLLLATQLCWTHAD